jgi:hypothetical protein
MICRPESWDILEDIMKELIDLENEYREESKVLKGEVDKSFNEGAAFAFHLIAEKIKTELTVSKDTFND